jgi:hypothetical protein
VANWRYIATELDGTLLAELPLNGVDFDEKLDGVGTLTANLLIPEDDTLAAIVVDACSVLRRAIHAERDGVIIWSGIVLGRKYRTSTRTFSLRCVGWWWLFGRRFLTADVTYTATDQGAIAEDLVEVEAQSAKPGGDLAVTSPTNTHGVTRDRTYVGNELKQIGEAVEQLSEVIDGFDWSLDTTYDAGSITHTFRTWYPRKGRIAGATGHVFELGRNIVELEVDEDGSICANTIHGVGAGEGADMVRVSVTDSSALAEGYPLLEDRLIRKDIKEIDTLDGHVRYTLAERSRPIESYTAVVLADADPPLGSYITGDDARVRVQPNDNHRWPDGLDTFLRIIGIKVSVPDQGTETVAITFGSTS